MAIGLVGRKAGMTRVFTDAGETVPVTVIEVLPNRVTQVKAQDKNGYRAVQVTYGTRRPQLYSKAVAGHYARANVAPGRALVEFRLTAADKTDLTPGAEIKADLFKEGEIVDVTGTTIGKGFAGTMKRHNFAGGYASHGNSLSHRAPGSIGQRQTPGRVFKGRRMSGHMGVQRRTTENLRVVQVDLERNLLLIRGAVPGAPGGQVIVRPSLKAARRATRKITTPAKSGGAPKQAAKAAPAKAAPAKAAPAKDAPKAEAAKALLEFGRELSSCEALEDVLDLVATGVGQLLGAPHTSVWSRSCTRC